MSNVREFWITHDRRWMFELWHDRPQRGDGGKWFSTCCAGLIIDEAVASQLADQKWFGELDLIKALQAYSVDDYQL